MLEEYVRKFWDAISIPQKFVSNPAGTYSIPVDETIAVIIRDLHDEGYYLYAEVADIPEGGDKEMFYINVMRGNLFGEGTGGAVLGLNADGKKLILTELLPRSVDYRNFEYTLEDFCNWIEFWREEPIKEIKKSSKPYF